MTGRRWRARRRRRLVCYDARAMRDPFDDILRVAVEPCEHVDDARVHALLTDRPSDYLAFVRDELRDVAQGVTALELPAKQVFADPDQRGDFCVMPCVVRGPRFVRKTVKLVGTNVVQERVADQITVGRAFALHPKENFVTHSFAACLLSSARTGACAALAAEQLAPRRASVSLIGAGRVGYYSALYLAALGGLERLHVHDRDRRRAERLARALAKRPAAAELVMTVGLPREPVDVLVLATTSAEPVYGPADLYAHTVISLGADTDWQHELAPELAHEAALFVDTLDSLNYGDLRQWVRAGRVSAHEPTDLLTLVRDGCRAPVERRRLFISTGSALFDNVTIGYLLARSSQGPAA